MAECNERAGWHGAMSFRRSDGVTVACSGSTVAAYQPGTNNLITIYSDHTGAPHANPFILDQNGQGDFYVDAVNCIFDLYVTSPAGVHASFRRRNQTAWVADMSPWPHDMDADGLMLSRLGQFLTVPVITAYDDDLQDAVNRLAATVPGTEGVIILPAGTYDLAATVDVTAGGTIQNLHLVGYGPDTLIRPANAAFNGSLVEFSAGVSRLKRFTISDMRFDGRSYATTWRGLFTTACQEVNICRVWAHDFQALSLGIPAGDGIRVGSTAANGESNTTNISDVHVSNVNRNGITISTGTRVKVARANFDSCDLYGIDVEPVIGAGADTARELHFVDCTADTGEHGFGITLDDPASPIGRRDYKMIGCTAKAMAGFGFLLAGGRSIELHGCDTESCSTAGINITNCNGVKVFGGEHRANDVGIRMGTRPAGAPGSGIWEDVDNNNVEFVGVNVQGSVAQGLKITEDTTVTGAVAQGHIGCLGCEFIDNGSQGIEVTGSVTSGALRLRLIGNVFDGQGNWSYFMNPAADLAGVVAIFSGNIAQNSGNSPNEYSTNAAGAHTRLISSETGAAASGDNVGNFV